MDAPSGRLMAVTPRQCQPFMGPLTIFRRVYPENVLLFVTLSVLAVIGGTGVTLLLILGFHAPFHRMIGSSAGWHADAGRPALN